MTVARLRAEMDSREFAAWLAYLELEPPDAEDWRRTALVCLNARQIAGDKQARLEHFMPRRAGDVKKTVVQSAEAMRAKLVNAFGARRKPR